MDDEDFLSLHLSLFATGDGNTDAIQNYIITYLINVIPTIHPDKTNLCDLINQILRIDPMHRISLEKIGHHDYFSDAIANEDKIRSLIIKVVTHAMSKHKL